MMLIPSANCKDANQTGCAADKAFIVRICVKPFSVLRFFLFFVFFFWRFIVLDLTSNNARFRERNMHLESGGHTNVFACCMPRVFIISFNLFREFVIFVPGSAESSRLHEAYALVFQFSLVVISVMWIATVQVQPQNACAQFLLLLFFFSSFV